MTLRLFRPGPVSALIFSLSIATTCTEAQIRLYSLGASAGFGYNCNKAAAISLGDLNADGFPEILVSGTGQCVTGWPSTFNVFEGKNGRQISQILSDQPGSNDGAVIAAVGDVDGDGRGDYIAGAPLYQFTGSPYVGRVQLRSGRLGGVIRDWFGSRSDSRFGTSLAYLGRAAGTSYGVACGIGTGGSVSPTVFSECKILNLSSGAVVESFLGTTSDGLGSALASVGDLTGDGIHEFVVSRPYDSNNTGRVELRNGATGIVMGSVVGSAFSRFGAKMWSLGLDASGAPLVGVSVPTSLTAQGATAQVYRVSSSGFTPALTFFYPGQVLLSMSEGADEDGNGLTEILVGVTTSSIESAVEVRAKGSGSLLKTIRGGNQAGNFGTFVGYLGDVNGDGRGDNAIAMNGLGGHSMSVFTSGTIATTKTACNLSPGDAFNLSGVVRPGGSVVLSGHITGASGGRLWLAFSDVSWESADPIRWGIDYLFPGTRCRSNLDDRTLTLGVPLTLDASGNYSYTWNLPNLPSAVGMLLRMSVYGFTASGDLMAFDEKVFQVQP